MSIEIKLPDIGSDEVEVTEILVNVGDRVDVDQSILTVEGDKASMEIPSPEAGTIKEIKISVGDKVTTGTLVMLFEQQKEEQSDASSSTTASASVLEPVADNPQGSRIQEVHVPDIGSDEVDVTEILIKVGDQVEAEQSLITVEGDKASMEVPSPIAGKVTEIKVNVGSKVSTGSLIMLFEVGAGSTNQVTQSTASSSPLAETTSQDITIPDIGGDEVEVTEVLISVGDQIAKEQSLITVEGDKASMEIPSPVAGSILAINVKVGDKVKTGSPMLKVETSSGSAPKSPTQHTSVAVSQSGNTSTTEQKTVSPAAKNEFVENDAYVHATPVIRRLAREFGINLANVKATGRKNRILREDVQVYVKEAVQRYEKGTVSGSGMPELLPWPNVDFSKFGQVEEQELTKIQKVSGANLHRNWVMIPHVTHFDESDITEMEAFRKQQNIEAEKKKLGVKITPVVFLMKAAASALAAYPRFNSSLSEDGQKLIIKKYINVGVAVDTPNGLVVPVFKDVDKKGIIELSHELTEVSKKARDGKLKGSDMQGGCFTISSLGGIGTTAFTPIVNAPEVAILGVSRSTMKPVWNGKEFEPRLILPLSLSFDHRVIDGADAARFITHLANIMADIRRLVM